jgi:hypothetical protein
MSKPMSNVDSPSPQGHEYEAKVLDVLKRAVAEALERKRKLGQYAGRGPTGSVRNGAKISNQ